MTSGTSSKAKKAGHFRTSLHTAYFWSLGKKDGVFFSLRCCCPTRWRISSVQQARGQGDTQEVQVQYRTTLETSSPINFSQIFKSFKSLILRPLFSFQPRQELPGFTRMSFLLILATSTVDSTDEMSTTLSTRTENTDLPSTKS